MKEIIGRILKIKRFNPSIGFKNNKTNKEKYLPLSEK
jgi:hypothetical protein